MRRFAVIVGALLVLGIGAAAVSAAIPDADGYTYTCVNNSSGTMQAREKGASCPKNWTASRLVANQAAIPNISTYEVVKPGSVPTGSGGVGFSANCHSGDIAVGGGFAAGPGVNVLLSAAGPNPPVAGAELASPTGWFGSFNSNDGLGHAVDVYAVCQHTA